MPHHLDDFICPDVLTIDVDDSLKTLFAGMAQPVDHGIPVVNDDGCVSGVIMPQDLLRLHLQNGSRADEMPAHAVCRRTRVLLSINASLRRARRLFLTRDLDSLLVIDRCRRLAGIIFRVDLERTGLLPERRFRWRQPLSRPHRKPGAVSKQQGSC